MGTLTPPSLVQVARETPIPLPKRVTIALATLGETATRACSHSRSASAWP
jgi:hypothetical protein